MVAVRDEEGRPIGFGEIAHEESAAERALRESEERFRLLVESCKDYAIFRLDTEGRVATWNKGAERIKGYRAGEIVGHHFSRFYLPEEVRAGKPARELEVAAAEGRFEDEGFRVRKDGTLFWANVVITALRDEAGALQGFGKVTRDLTERKRGEERAQKLAAEQAAAAESARAARYLAEASAALGTSLDREATLEGLARLVVPTFADWCAIDLVEDGTIRPLTVAHVDPSKVELGRELQRRYPADPKSPFGVPNVVRTGAAELYPEIPAAVLDAVSRDAGMRSALEGLGLRSAMVVPLAARGRTLGAITLVRAESDQRYDDKDLVIARDLGLRAGLAVDNARLYEEARRAISIRDEFLAIASHELRMPLTALQLQLQGLRRLVAKGSADPAHLADRLEKAITFSGRFEALVTDLLAVTRIAAGRLRLDVREVDVTAIVREVVERLSDDAARVGSTIELRDRGPVTLQGDRARIDQVLTNLVGNAVKFGAGEPIRVSVGKEGDRAVIIVQDQGIGVAPELHRRIFERFERGISDRTYGGFGLGLWIAREIVVAHGGTITIESAAGAGSTFRMEMPLAPPEAMS
jgi:PAS domain S-box-containing protein